MSVTVTESKERITNESTASIVSNNAAPNIDVIWPSSDTLALPNFENEVLCLKIYYAMVVIKNMDLYFRNSYQKSVATKCLLYCRHWMRSQLTSQTSSRASRWVCGQACCWTNAAFTRKWYFLAAISARLFAQPIVKSRITSAQCIAARPVKGDAPVYDVLVAPMYSTIDYLCEHI